MATYKVIQDIEADDKLLGPLSLKQFIYFCITAVCLYLTFFSVTKGAAFLAIIFMPPAIFFGVLGVPWSKTQPTEIWLLAKIRFFFKPRKRIWDQAGIKELVTITVPKKIERKLSDGLDQRQVHSRLTALAKTVDSRGWAVKKLAGVPYGDAPAESDRLTAGTQTNNVVAAADPGQEADVLDEQNNPTAQKINQLINQSSENHKKAAIEHMKQAEKEDEQKEKPVDYWFMNQNDPSKTPAGKSMGQPAVVSPSGSTAGMVNRPDSQDNQELDEEALLKKIHESKAKHPDPYQNPSVKTILPLSEQKKRAKEKQKKKEAEEQAKRAAEAQAQADANKKAEEEARKREQSAKVMEFANNDDLNVETIARQANKKDDDHPDEVVVNLH